MEENEQNKSQEVDRHLGAETGMGLSKNDQGNWQLDIEYRDKKDRVKKASIKADYPANEEPDAAAMFDIVAKADKRDEFPADFYDSAEWKSFVRAQDNYAAEKNLMNKLEFVNEEKYWDGVSVRRYQHKNAQGREVNMVKTPNGSIRMMVEHPDHEDPAQNVDRDAWMKKPGSGVEL
jgi:hypothetical protein